MQTSWIVYLFRIETLFKRETPYFLQLAHENHQRWIRSLFQKKAYNHRIFLGYLSWYVAPLSIINSSPYCLPSSPWIYNVWFTSTLS